MRTYQFGSLGLSHEQRVTVPDLSWLGLKSDNVLDRNLQHPEESFASSRPPSDVEETSSQYSTYYNQPRSPPETHCFPESAESFSALTARDRRMAANLIDKVIDQGNMDENGTDVIHELQIMLMLNIKAEIQAVENVRCIASWLDEQLAIGITRTDH